jgi:aminoglycoside phosphotransferase (APT) family kinase protein
MLSYPAVALRPRPPDMPCTRALEALLCDQVAHDLPPLGGFARMARALGLSGNPSELRRLTGGLEADTFSFRLTDQRFVVKIYVNDGGRSLTEFENLAAVSIATVATPEPVLLDAAGAWFGSPAIVMTALTGKPDMHPNDRQLWIHDAAEALASIHSISANRSIHARSPRWQRWRPSVEAMKDDSLLTDSLLTRLHEQAVRLPTVVSHDDYNPGNLLFENGHLSGVVDWADITIEPRQAAVALFRHFLAIHPGGDTP